MIYRPFDSGCGMSDNRFESYGSSQPRSHNCCCCCPIFCCRSCDLSCTSNPSAPSVNALTAINTAAQAPAANAVLTFAENPTLIGNAISHSPGSSAILIHTPGVYQISFHATVSPTAATEVPHNSVLQLQRNGVDVPSAVAAHLSLNTADASTIGFSYLLSVNTTPVTLTVVSKIANSSITSAVINVTRIGSISSGCTATV